jgi:hypothetical protein
MPDDREAGAWRRGTLCRFPTTQYRRTRLWEGRAGGCGHAIGPIDVIGYIDDRAGVSAKDSARGPG